MRVIVFSEEEKNSVEIFNELNTLISDVDFVLAKNEMPPSTLSPSFPESILIVDYCENYLKDEKCIQQINAYKEKEIPIGVILPLHFNDELWEKVYDDGFDFCIFHPFNKYQILQQLKAHSKSLHNYINSDRPAKSPYIQNFKNKNELIYLTKSYATYSGKEFFERISEFIAIKMDLDSMFVGEYQKDTKSVRMVGGYDNGGPMDELDYMLEDTPCSEVMGQNICVYEEGVQEKFPKDHLLKEFKIEGYVGSPLLDKEGKSLGVLVGTKTTPIDNGELILNYLRFFVDFIAAEILRERVEKEYQKSLIELNQAQKVAKVGSWYWDMEKNKLEWSNEMYELYGLKKPVEDKVTAVRNLIFEEDLPIFDKAMSVINNDITPPNIQYRIRRNDGEIVYVDANLEKIKNKEGQLIYLVGTAQNITKLKKAQIEIKEEKQRVENIIIGTNAGIWEWDIQNGIAYINERYAEILGYSKQELEPFETKFFNDLNHPDDLKYVDEEVEKVFNKEKEYFDLEFRMKHKNGKYVWVSSRGKVVQWLDEYTPQIMSGIQLDINEQKRINSELINAKSKAEESDRLKTAFLANMSHEIRTPMNGILGFLDIINNEIITDSEQKQYLEIIEKNSQRLLSTINDIIEISIIESGNFKIAKTTFDLHKVFQELHQFFLPETQKKAIDFHLSCKNIEEKYEIYTDKNKIESNLINLIKNAIKFTHSGFIKFGFIEEEDKLIFFIKDSGLGIAKDRQRAVFERFVQADLSSTRDDEGSGLGLSICKAYAEILGGKIWLESELGKGSAFYFSISLS